MALAEAAICFQQQRPWTCKVWVEGKREVQQAGILALLSVSKLMIREMSLGDSNLAIKTTDR